jgi:hypothetical protein
MNPRVDAHIQKELVKSHGWILVILLQESKIIEHCGPIFEFTAEATKDFVFV